MFIIIIIVPPFGSASGACCSFTGNHLNCGINTPSRCANENGDSGYWMGFKISTKFLECNSAINSFFD